MTRCSRRRSPTSSAFTSTRRSGPSCCVWTRKQIQALDRTQPGLPLKKGRAATMTHDYKRHGTTTLFAALDVKSGKVIGECLPRHRAKEFLRFLRRIDRHVPKSREVHLVLDNYATHKTPEVRAWLNKHPRFKLHFTPTSASWLNLVERFFAEITSSASAAAAIAASTTWRPPSTTTCCSTTPSQSHSDGPRPPRISSHGSAVRWTPSIKSEGTGRKRQTQSTS